MVYQGLRLPYVAQVPPYLNNLSKTNTDIYLNIQTVKIRNTNLIHSIIEYLIKSLLAKTSPNTKHNIISKYIKSQKPIYIFKKYLKIQNREFITKTK